LADDTRLCGRALRRCSSVRPRPGKLRGRRQRDERGVRQAAELRPGHSYSEINHAGLNGISARPENKGKFRPAFTILILSMHRGASLRENVSNESACKDTCQDAGFGKLLRRVDAVANGKLISVDWSDAKSLFVRRQLRWTCKFQTFMFCAGFAA